MRRNWTHRCSSSHCPQNCSNSSNPHRNNRHCYSYRRQGRPQGAGTPPDTAPYIPIFIFLKTTTPPNGGNSGGVPPPFLPLLLTQRCQQRARGRVRADGTRIIYKYSVYRCRQGVNLHRCPNRKLVFETTLEKMLLERIRPELENYIAEYEVANLPALRTDAKRRSVEGKMQKLKDLYLNDLITMDEFKLDREKLLMQLEKINAEDSRPVKDLSYLKNFLKMDFESVYDSLSIPERRELWRSIVKEIRVDHDKNIHIIFL